MNDHLTSKLGRNELAWRSHEHTDFAKFGSGSHGIRHTSSHQIPKPMRMVELHKMTQLMHDHIVG